ncbi:MAG: rRNA adenine dimethyltransferase family protein [Microgenomates group bacterium]
MPARQEIPSPIQQKLTDYEILPKERLGQHILVDQNILNFIAQQVSPGANVIEVGAGPGNLTEALTKTAKRVVGIEIDRQYGEILEDLQAKVNQTGDTENETMDPFSMQGTIKKNKLSIIFGDALKLKYDKIMAADRDGSWEVAANIPYHISEPFLKLLTELPIDNAILMVGDNFGKALLTDNPLSDWYTKSSLIANAFFSVENLMELPASGFYPFPSTRSYLMRLTPYKGEDVNQWNSIFRQLIRNERSKPVRSILETAFSNTSEAGNLRSKTERNRYDRRETNRELARLTKSGTYLEDSGRRAPQIGFANIGKKLQLPDRILDTQFGSMNNEDLRVLSVAIHNYFSR